MQSEGTLSRHYHPEELVLVEEELAKYATFEELNEQQITVILSNLQVRASLNTSREDILLFFQKCNQEQRVKQQVVPTAVPQNTETSTAFFRQFAEPMKAEQPKRERNVEKKWYVSRSKRKVKPSEGSLNRNIQELVQYLDNNTNDCHILFQRKNRKNNAQKDTAGILHEQCQWIYNEHFYSILDKTYLKDEEPLKKLLEEVRFNPEGMTFYDYTLLKLALPKPKLFNSEFINAEIEKLNDYRNQIRSYPKQKSKNEELTVGREVIAVHPVCGHLHSGSILAIYKENQYMVKFVKPELGTQKILDINITLKEVNHPHKIIIENVNFEAMALTIKLLEYKSDLLKVLSKYNDVAQEAQKESNGLDNRFFQQYGWIGSTINILSLGIKHILSKFRVRGLDQANQEKIGKNFASVLINPLNLMEKELDKSSQNSDLNASYQIKRIISNYKESKTDQYTRELLNRHWGSLKDMDWNTEQREEFEVLMKCLVGILVSLKIEHKNFSIEDNKYLKELITHFDNRYPEHFNQIYELLTSITSKLNEEQK